MQRIEFTTDDLMRTGVITVGPLAETLFALRTLQARSTPVVFDNWRRQARRGIGVRAQQIAGLFSPTSMLDLITVIGPVASHDDAVARVADAPVHALQRELHHLERTYSLPLPSWTVDLARGTGSARTRLAAGVHDAYSGTIAGLWPGMKLHLDTERSRYVQALAVGGVEQLFACLSPHARWRPPVLELIGAAVAGATRLNGRGMQIVPSVFCYRPEFFWELDGDGPALLFVPALHDPVTAMHILSGSVATSDGPHLHHLLGRSRAAVLEVVAAEPGITTGMLGTRLGFSAASASEHATVLRQSGLIDSARHRNTVRHTVTELGRAMLNHRPPVPGAVRQ